LCIACSFFNIFLLEVAVVVLTPSSKNLLSSFHDDWSVRLGEVAVSTAEGWLKTGYLTTDDDVFEVVVGLGTNLKFWLVVGRFC
jgi:hypothetical protein